jgi:heme/copper-type cytochrome/quinol oxidase subunit 2
MKMSLTIIFLVAVAILVILLLVEVYLVVTVVSSGRQPASGSMATSDGRYRFSWTIANGEITVAFAVRTNPGTWAAVGFSEDKLMVRYFDC